MRLLHRQPGPPVAINWLVALQLKDQQLGTTKLTHFHNVNVPGDKLLFDRVVDDLLETNWLSWNRNPDQQTFPKEAVEVDGRDVYLNSSNSKSWPNHFSRKVDGRDRWSSLLHLISDPNINRLALLIRKNILSKSRGLWGSKSLRMRNLVTKVTNFIWLFSNLFALSSKPFGGL